MQETHKEPTEQKSPHPHDAEGSQEAPQSRREKQEHTWLSALIRELFQTEESAKTHPKVEAERLGDVPPTRALLAVSAHAEAVLAELPEVVKGHHLPVSEGGKAVGVLFSVVRDNFGDLLLSMDKSYRGTLLGMRHGVDLVEMIQYLSTAHGDTSLAAWCARWLETRRPLVEAVGRELAWFAAHPERATEPAKHNPVATAVQAIFGGFEQLADRLRHRDPTSEGD